MSVKPQKLTLFDGQVWSSHQTPFPCEFTLSHHSYPELVHVSLVKFLCTGNVSLHVPFPQPHVHHAFHLFIATLWETHRKTMAIVINFQWVNHRTLHAPWLHSGSSQRPPVVICALYSLVMQHNYGKSPFIIGKSRRNVVFSIQ